jgi:hypothetical protein
LDCRHACKSFAYHDALQAGKQNFLDTLHISFQRPWLALAVTHIQSDRNSSDITKRYVSDSHFLCLRGGDVAVEVCEVQRIQKTVIDKDWEGINKDVIAACLHVMSAFVSMKSKSHKCHRKPSLCAISGFSCGVNEICALVGFYTA